MKTSNAPSQSVADVGSTIGGPVTWIFSTAIRGIRGQRPLGDPFSPGQRTFGPFLQRIAAQVQQRERENELPPLPEPEPVPEEWPPRVRQSPIPRPPRSGWQPAPGPPKPPPLPEPEPDFFPGYEPPNRGRGVPDRDGGDYSEEFWDDYRREAAGPPQVIDWQAFAPGNFPMPQPVKIPLPTVLPTILRTVIGVLGWILYPSRTADDDTIPEAEPAPIPKGPPRRPRVGRPQPYGWPEPDWYNYARRRRPRMPGVLWPRTDVPGRPAPWEYPEPSPRSVPADRPGTRRGRRELPRGDPFPTGRPTPSPVPRPVPFDPVPWLLPFLRPGLRPARPGARPGVPRPDVSNPFGPDPLTPSEPRGVDSPLQFEQPQFRADRCPPCDCSKTDRKRKRKKDSCTNPISSKRTFTRGGARFRTITRKLQCPV